MSTIQTFCPNVGREIFPNLEIFHAIEIRFFRLHQLAQKPFQKKIQLFDVSRDKTTYFRTQRAKVNFSCCFQQQTNISIVTGSEPKRSGHCLHVLSSEVHWDAVHGITPVYGFIAQQNVGRKKLCEGPFCISNVTIIKVKTFKVSQTLSV